jgi:ParB family chromosome partitioning protein
MIQNINIDKISPHPDNPRKDLGDLTELAESIKAQGILQNLTVVPYIGEVTGQPIEGKYRVVIGHRRLAAAKLAGLSEVPCVISDMKLHEQVATMLLENIQRNDLTVYEQAQGFQLMLNLGDTVNDISRRTGFSETTVRRRVKLLELDSKKFKAAVDRGATLMDFAELEKIQNLELRNKVLDKIGTPNFKWDLQAAIDKEKAEANAAKIVAVLETFAKKTTDTSNLQYVKGYGASQGSIVEVPEDAETEEYFYTVSGNWFTLYKARPQTEANTAEAERRKRQQECRAALEEITKRAYQLRRKFVKEISNTTAKKNIGHVIEYSIRAMIDGYVGVELDDYIEFLGIEVDEDAELDFDIILETIKAQPERYLLMATYLKLDSERESYYDWDNKYSDNESLNIVYNLLERLGYEMSDEERAIRGGTHELFKSIEEEK